jgi:hypothetical protein
MPTHGGLSNSNVDNSGVEPHVARLGKSTYKKLTQTYLYIELKILYFPPVFHRPVQVKHQIVTRVRRIINQNLASSNHLGEQLHHGIIISFSSSLFCNSWTVLIFPPLLFCNSEWSTLYSFLVFLLFPSLVSKRTLPSPMLCSFCHCTLPSSAFFFCPALQFMSYISALSCFLLLSCSAIYILLICPLLFCHIISCFAIYKDKFAQSHLLNMNTVVPLVYKVSFPLPRKVFHCPSLQNFHHLITEFPHSLILT